jgi:hypothetical protein
MSSSQKSEGFGFFPEESGHHFLVTIHSAKSPHVYISEHFSWDDSQERRNLSFALGNEDDKMRVILPRTKWLGIAEAVQAEFNRRLKRNGMKVTRWKTGETPVSRLLGKEMVLLAWAIEDADPALIPVAIKNWLGLAPEERWWLFTMTNAATGHAVSGRNKGWRKAVRYALTENPVSDNYPAEPRQELLLIMKEALSWSSELELTHPKKKEESSGDDKIVY